MEFDAIKKITRTSAQKVYEPAKPASHRQMAEVRASFLQETDSAPEDKASSKKIDEVAAEVQIQLKRLNTELRFDVDNESRETIVRIIDVETGEVIRQIPSEDILALRDRMDDLIGVLYRLKA